MFILSLPMLPLACICWLQDRYIIGYNLPPEKRMLGTKEGFVAMMCALEMFVILYGGIFLLAKGCVS